MRRYAMSRGRYGWAVHLRSGTPEVSLCGVALKSTDFPASASTEICARCRRREAAPYRR